MVANKAIIPKERALQTYLFFILLPHLFDVDTSDRFPNLIAMMQHLLGGVTESGTALRRPKERQR